MISLRVPHANIEVLTSFDEIVYPIPNPFYVYFFLIINCKKIALPTSNLISRTKITYS